MSVYLVVEDGLGWAPALQELLCNSQRGSKVQKTLGFELRGLWKGAGGATAIMPTRLGKVAEFSE